MSSATQLFAQHPHAWEVLQPLARRRQLSRDEMLLHHGDAATQLWLVESGWVKLTRHTPDGKETIVGLCTAGDVLGEAALFPYASYPYDAETISDDAVLLGFPAETLRTLLQKDAALSASVMELLNQRVSQTQLKLEHMSTLTAAQRLGCFLLRLCHAHEGAANLKIPVEKHVLAAYLGMKPETLSRSQQQLKAVGVEVNGHGVKVNQIANLREFVCGSCSESGSCDVEMALDE